MKKKIMNFLLIVLSLFLISGCEQKEEKVEPGETKQEEKIEEKNIEKEMTEEEKNTLLKIIDELKYLDYRGESFKSSDLTNQEVLQFAITKVKQVEGTSFTELENITKKYLGYNIKAENILCVPHYAETPGSKYVYKYNPKTNKYSYDEEHLGHGGGGFMTDIYNRYKDSKIINDEYKITVYKAFSEILGDVWETDDFKYYPTYEDAATEKNELFTSRENKVIKKLNEIDASKLTEFTYTFKLENDNFILVSYDINK